MRPAIRQVLLAGSAPVAGALMDTFQTVSAAMNGLALTPYGGGNWVQDPGVGVTSNPQVPSTGVLQINSGAGVTKDAIWLPVGSTKAARWNTYRINPVYNLATASGIVRDFSLLSNPIVITPTTSYAVVTHYFTKAGVGLGNLTAYHALSGALDITTTNDVYQASSMTGKKQGDFFCPWAGDTLQVRKVTAGAVVTYDFYQNGFRIAQGTVDLAAAYAAGGKALNDYAGIKGDAQTNTPNLLSFFELGDPASQAMLTVKKMGHTAQIKWWDGSNDTYVPLKGEYSLSPPRALYYSVVNAATGATVSGPTLLSGLSTTAPVNGVGSWTVAPITITAASTPAVFYIKVERQDILGLAKAFAFTPNMNPGWVVGGFGQSLMTQMWQLPAAGITVAPPANSWIADGSIDQGGGTYPGANTDFRVHISTCASSPYGNATSNATYMLQPLATAAGHSNFAFIRGGYGGTVQTSRQPNAGHGIYEAFQDGIDRVGDIGVIVFDGGTYETNGTADIYSVSWPTFTYGTDTVTYKAQLDTFLQTIEGFVGHPVRMVLSPPPSIDATNTATLDARSNALARANWELITTNGGFGTVTGSNPQRYYQGAFDYDLQHASGDQYHLNVAAADGYGEEARRWGYTLAKVCGYAANDRVGPSIDDTFTPVRSTNTIKVRFNLNGATTMALTGFAFASDGRGGMQFWTDNTFTSELLCTTTPSIGSPSGGKVDVTWTLTSTPGAAVVITGPRGLSPFNRGQNATITANMVADASVIRGTFSDPEATFVNPPVQPYFNGAFLTNNTHDYLTST